MLEGQVGLVRFEPLGTEPALEQRVPDLEHEVRQRLELGLIVANTRVVSFDNVTSAVTVAKAPTEGATGEVTYDVIGFPDDSVSGERLVITGQQIDDSTIPVTGFARAVVYELVSVIATDICARGAGVDRELCV